MTEDTSILENKPTRSLGGKDNQVVKISKSFGKQGDKSARKQVGKVIEGKAIRVNKDTSPHVLRDIRRLLIENDLGLEYVIKKYKEVLDSGYERPKAGDVLKVLNRLEKLHGVEDQSNKNQQLPEAIGTALASGDLEAYIVKITKKTSEYLDRGRAIEGEEVKT